MLMFGYSRPGSWSARERWLNDSVISAAISGEEVNGFQNTQLGKKLAFSPVSPYKKFIHVYVDGLDQWMMVSFVSVCIYDSRKTSIASVLTQRSKFAALLNQRRHSSLLTSWMCSTRQIWIVCDCRELVYQCSLTSTHLWCTVIYWLALRVVLLRGSRWRRCPVGNKVRKSSYTAHVECPMTRGGLIQCVRQL